MLLLTSMIFAGALLAAVATIWATIAPALPRIQAALAGQSASPLPVLPPRRVVTARRLSPVRVTLPASMLRAAA